MQTAEGKTTREENACDCKSQRTPRSPVRKQSSNEELEAMAAKLRSRKARSLSQQRKTPTDLENAAAGIVRARRRPGLPRRAKSERNVYQPADHRSASPCRPCLLRQDSERKKGMSRQVSFGTKSYDEIPKAEEEEKTAIWYDETELKDLRKQVKKLARKGIPNESEDCSRGLEPYVQEYQKRKSCGPTDQQQCNKLLLEAQTETEKRKSEELKSMAQDFLQRFAEAGTKKAEQDAAEARAIYMETMDQEQVSRCFLRSLSGGVAQCA